MYLLDTNACLDFLLARSRAVFDRVGREFGRLTVSSITVAELHVGKKTSTDPVSDTRNLENFLALVSVAPFADEAALACGDVARAHGVDRHSFDRLIAAHALALRLILITSNERDFARIPGLTVENWRAM